MQIKWIGMLLAFVVGCGVVVTAGALVSNAKQKPTQSKPAMVRKLSAGDIAGLKNSEFWLKQQIASLARDNKTKPAGRYNTLIKVLTGQLKVIQCEIAGRNDCKTITLACYLCPIYFPPPGSPQCRACQVACWGTGIGP